MAFEDLMPGKTKKRQLKRRNGEDTASPQRPPDPEPTTMRVRILKTLRGSRSGTFMAGQVANLPIAVALSWISIGFAEEDKMREGAPETK